MLQNIRLDDSVDDLRRGLQEIVSDDATPSNGWALFQNSLDIARIEGFSGVHLRRIIGFVL